MDNSFFDDDFYDNKKILILAPHPDDEINIAGSVIHNFASKGAEVFVLYSTNGDYEWPAEIRFGEAIDSLRILGVKKTNIIFLGYGDTFNHTGDPHLFYASNVVESPAGYSSTYGCSLKQDYAYEITGNHSEYTRENYFHDLKSAICRIRADFIFCVDFDQHADHRMLSIMFEKVMGNILTEPGNDYYPAVFKKFAYSLNYAAEKDFSVFNLLSTKYPVCDGSDDFAKDFINYSVYQWDERIRVPVDKDCLVGDLSRNILAMAGCSHKSQRIEENLLGIINSDEVFWCRRTDGISYKANINVSSGDGSKLNDFQLINLVDIDDDVPVIGDYLWTPDLLDEEKKAVFNWNEVQSISSVKIYGNIDDTSAINKLKIVFGSGQEYEVGPLPNNGEPLEMCFDKPLLTKACMVKLLDVTGDKYGISECEFYSSLEEGSHLPPYCKMMIDDNFVYYYVTNAKRLKLSTYQYGIVGKPVYDILEGHAEVDSDGNVLIKDFQSDIIIKCAMDTNSDVYDIITITPYNFYNYFREYMCKIKNMYTIKKSKLMSKSVKWHKIKRS